MVVTVLSVTANLPLALFVNIFRPATFSALADGVVFATAVMFASCSVLMKDMQVFITLSRFFVTDKYTNFMSDSRTRKFYGIVQKRRYFQGRKHDFSLCFPTSLPSRIRDGEVSGCNARYLLFIVEQ